jgi:DNA-binding CsgD family transcriptional regulator
MTKSMSRPSRHALAAPENIPAVDGALRILALLDSHDLHVAPVVAARLERELAGDEAAILQTASWMTTAQRRGTEALPDPLPLLDQVESSVGDPRLEAWEFEVLIAAAVCVDDRTELLLEVADRPIGDLVAGGVSRHLRLVAGHFAFADPRMRVWVHGSASLAERTAVHARLADIHARLDEPDLACWHRALRTLEGDPALVAPLLALARSVLATGDAARAHAIAREATSHAVDGAQHHEAAFVTGLAALAAGFVDDAVRRLAPVIAGVTGARETTLRAEALGAHLAAVTWHSGVVPETELEACLAPESHRDAAVARTSAIAAALLAERGDADAAARWCARAAVGDATGAASAFARSWLALHAGAVDEVRGDGSVLGAIAEALALGLRGSSVAALRRVGSHESAAAPVHDEVILGLERSPVARAYRAVAATLLQFWGGDVSGARETLQAAAIELPVTIPFAGLALTLARRLELAVTGETGALTRALACSVPHAGRGDALLDAAIADLLDDRVDEASMRARLHHELHPMTDVLWVPGVDEVGPLDTVAQGIDGHLPPDAAQACRVRALARSADRVEELEEAAELARTLDSPFERGRTEAAIGAAWAAIGEPGAARRHLVVAESLLDGAGADAWSALARRRRDRLVVDEAGESPSVPREVPTASAAWREVLTERELEVTLLVIEGASNREIAAQLYVSVRTVEVHVGRILAKLDVRSRVELTVLAHRVGLSA